MDGILLVDKPIFYTSHDLVDVLRRKTGIRRIGHAGTLDPLATGLLVMLIGRATSLFDRLAGSDKEYEGILMLGLVTDTQDLEGRILRIRDVETPAPENIRQTLRSFLGPQKQRIPRFSSARVSGRKSYELARKKIDFEAREKDVDVKELDFVAAEESEIYFRTRVSSGTYIRALCEAIGEKLGPGACLAALRRISSGPYHVRNALTIEQIRAAEPALIRRALLPLPSENAEPAFK